MMCRFAGITNKNSKNETNVEQTIEVQTRNSEVNPSRDRFFPGKKS